MQSSTVEHDGVQMGPLYRVLETNHSDLARTADSIILRESFHFSS